jgi:hypothetical protein
MATPPPNASPNASTAPAPEIVTGLVSEFLHEKKQEEAEAAKAAAPRRKRPIALAFMVVLCGAVWFAPVPPGMPDPFADVTATTPAVNRGLEMLSARVVDFHRTKGRLPRTLAEAGITDSVMYVAGATTFSISMEVGGLSYSKATSMDTIRFAPESVSSGSR